MMESVEGTANSNKVKSMLSVVAKVLVYVVCALCICLLVFTFVSKRSEDGTIGFFGHEMRLVVSGSMEKNENTDVSNYEIKSIPVKSMVFIKKVPEDEAAAETFYSSLKVGDVLTFNYLEAGKQVVITHRIIEIESKSEGGYIITLRADNGEGSSQGWQKQIIDTSIAGSSNYVIGKVTGQSRLVGFITYYLRQPIGLILIILIPSALIVITECVRFRGLLSEYRKNKNEEK